MYGVDLSSTEITMKRTMTTVLQTLLSVAVLWPAQALAQETLPAWTQSASSCVIDENTASQSRYAFNNADLAYKAGTISVFSNSRSQPIVARCNVLNPLDTGNPLWNKLVVGYLNPMGAGTVVVDLKKVTRAGSVATIATFNSSNFNQPDFFLRLEASVTFNHTFDFLNNQYYVEIRILRHDTDGNPGVFAIRLTHAAPQ